MAAKRGASNQLTDRNWDEEEEPEEAGVFVQANENVLKTRQIKKAKRRGVAGDSNVGAGAFKGFGGFGGASATPAAPTFSFGSSANKPLSLTPNVLVDKPLGGVTTGSTPHGGLATLTSKPVVGDSKPVVGDSKPFSLNNNKPTESKELVSHALTNGTKDKKSKYYAQLKSLNEGVSKWILKHVEKNPTCILTPIFKDYEKHLAEIEKMNPGESDSEEKVEESKESTETPVATQKPDDLPSVPSSGGFKIAEPAKTTSTAPAPVFSFGSGALSGSAGSVFGGATGSSTGSLFGGTAGFSFKPADKMGDTGSTGGFTFANSKPVGNTAANAGDEEYVPPKPEVSEVQEEGAVYTKRCKLFYQKDGAWVERGVGNIHIKPCDGKTQLVMRADTSLGNIILNIMLNSSIPLKRQGKNNVSMICIPNPPIDPKVDDKKPASLLIRVKTGDDADELLEQLQKYQKE